MYLIINSNNILRVFSDYHVLCTHWIISFTPHNKVATIITHRLQRTKPSSKRWNKLTKVTFVNGGAKIWTKVCMTPESMILTSIHPASYLDVFPSITFWEIVTCVIWFSVHTAYGGQFSWTPFSQHITEVPKNLIRKGEKRDSKLNKIL